jgi:hypothetical protein
MAKCPHCKAQITRVVLSEVTAAYPFGKSWKAIAYDCPDCEATMSVQIDPIAVKADVVDDVVSRIAKLLGRA